MNERLDVEELDAPPTESKGLVLVVDDEPDVCRIVRRWLERAGYGVQDFPDGNACLAALGYLLPDAICLDLQMPGLGGLETLQEIRIRHRLLPVVILTADTAVETVVRAMRLGAFDYLTKPIDSTALTTTIRNAVDRHRMSLRVLELESAVQGRSYPGILGGSQVMRDVYQKIDRVAASDVTVLIVGESGAGKELVARAIHENSGRSKGPFVTLNCAAIPETLQESELFGHERGAFTGATARRTGSFELADGGTLFLDEVAELSPGLQAKLLRVLQERRFRRLGGSTEVHSDFRLLAATHQDLARAVQQGEFREDLFYRIAVLELDLPPLRDRGDDVLLLATRFVDEFTRKSRKPRSLSPEVCQRLLAYHWPGNVRELRNVIQRAVVMSNDEVVLPQHLPERLRDVNSTVAQLSSHSRSSDNALRANGSLNTDPAGFEPPNTLNLVELERYVIARALQQTGGNIREVAKLLGIGRTTLYRKLKKYGLRSVS